LKRREGGVVDLRASHPIDERAFAEFAQVLSSIQTADDMRQFLRELLTPGEIRDIALRWKLLEMLADGRSQRVISESLQVSLCKITRGSKILKQSGGVAARLLRLRRQAEQRG